MSYATTTARHKWFKKDSTLSQDNHTSRVGRLKQFEHESLGSRDQFRLLRIVNSPKTPTQLQIKSFTFNTHPEYTALAYAWGDLDVLHLQSIEINKKRFQIRSNLWEFFQSTQTPKNHWLWIDALCIDQTHNQEKNHQVKCMA
jgi:hypothetical protein